MGRYSGSAHFRISGGSSATFASCWAWPCFAAGCKEYLDGRRLRSVWSLRHRITVTVTNWLTTKHKSATDKNERPALARLTRPLTQLGSPGDSLQPQTP